MIAVILLKLQSVFLESDMSTDEGNSLVIIGNGFDLSLGIKSSYTDFLNYLLSSHNLRTTEEIYSFNKLFVQNFDGKCLNWCDFETIFEKQIIEVNQSTNSKELGYTKEFLINQINQDLQELEILFSEYLEKEFEAWQKNWIKIKADEHKKVNSFYEKLFEKASMIINFNYTASIENIFPNLDAVHIHGRLDEGNIIFGGGFSGSSLLDDTSVKGSTENDKLIRSKKNPKITEQRNKVLKKIDVQKFSSIFVLGHSIIGSDFIFLKPLFKNAKKIYVFYYEQDYEEKFQFLVQNLEKNIVEKIELVPFFEVIIEKNKIIISREEVEDKDDYNAVSDSFNFPIPTDESNTFLNFEITTESFLVWKLKNLVINTNTSLKAIYNLLSKLPDDYIDNISDDFFSIRIKGQTDPLKRSDISDLFKLPLFRKLFEKAKIFELSNCNIDLSDLSTLFEINNLKKIKIENNNIFFMDEVGNSFDLTSIFNIEKIIMSNNEFVEETKGTENNKIKVDYPLLVTKTVMKTKILEIQDNTNLQISTSILEYFREIKEISISINSISEKDVYLPHIERLELFVDENNDIQPLPKLMLNNKIKELRFGNFILNEKNNGEVGQDYEPLYLSTLFEKNGRKAILENLEVLEFNNCEIPGGVAVDIFVNIFRNDLSPKIKTDKEILFRDIMLESTHKFDSFIGTLIFNEERKNEDVDFTGKLSPAKESTDYDKDLRVKELEKTFISKNDIQLNLEKIFFKNPHLVGDLNLDGNKNEIIKEIIISISNVLVVSEKHLEDSFESYKYNQTTVPYISDIVESLSIFGEKFVTHYEKFFDGRVKFRNRVVIIEQVWRQVLDIVLMPIERGRIK